LPQTLGQKLRDQKPQKDQYPPTVLKTKLKEHFDRQTVCKILGITPLTASRIMRGCDLKLSHALKLSKYLGVSLTDLWEAL
jgi:plasmid maintenance system antidote protein VapI